MFGPVLPDVTYERFANPPLRAMLGQVQFPIILRLGTGPQAVADLQDAIRDEFPAFAVQQQMQIVVGPDGTQAQPQTSSAFRFGTADGRWSVLLAPAALTLEANAGGAYSSYDEFARLFRKVWSAVAEHLKPGEISQQGLRYVDHIEGERTPGEWAETVNPALLGPLLTDELGVGVGHAISELTYPREDGRIDFRHGIATAGPGAEVGYLLDFDAIQTQPIDAADVDGIMARFNASHELLYRFFRWCITDQATKEFRHADA